MISQLLIKSELKFAEETLIFDKNGTWIGNRTIPLHAEAKEFFEKIITSENINPDINKEVQKRLNRDFSE